MNLIINFRLKHNSHDRKIPPGSTGLACCNWRKGKARITLFPELIFQNGVKAYKGDTKYYSDLGYDTPDSISECIGHIFVVSFWECYFHEFIHVFLHKFHEKGAWKYREGHYDKQVQFILEYLLDWDEPDDQIFQSTMETYETPFGDLLNCSGANDISA